MAVTPPHANLPPTGGPPGSVGTVRMTQRNDFSNVFRSLRRLRYSDDTLRILLLSCVEQLSVSDDPHEVCHQQLHYHFVLQGVRSNAFGEDALVTGLHHGTRLTSAALGRSKRRPMPSEGPVRL